MPDKFVFDKTKTVSFQMGIQGETYKKYETSYVAKLISYEKHSAREAFDWRGPTDPPDETC